ncbi:MAG TPA: hypothetical protein DDX85_13995 [Nitrospiraceae bacterium]|nr:hypothetical protein [Nitrospiraceae bacterium]
MISPRVCHRRNPCNQFLSEQTTAWPFDYGYALRAPGLGGHAIPDPDKPGKVVVLYLIGFFVIHKH